MGVNFRGCGTIYYGWRHLPDGTAEATHWFALLFLPLVPLARHRLRLLSDPDAESALGLTLPPAPAEPAGGEPTAETFHFGLGSLETRYEILARLPLDGRSVLKTYLKAYLGLPLLLGLPLAGVILLGRVLDPRNRDAHLYLLVGLVLVWFGFCLAVLATLVHRARGGRR